MARRGKDNPTPAKKLFTKYKAKVLRDVFVETGQIDPVKAHEICFPGQHGEAHKTNSTRDFDEAVMKEFARLITLSDKQMKSLSSGGVTKELTDDLARLNTLLQHPDNLTIDEFTKLLAAKVNVLKLLGLARGTWYEGKHGNKDTGSEDVTEDFLKDVKKRYN